MRPLGQRPNDACHTTHTLGATAPPRGPEVAVATLAMSYNALSRLVGLAGVVPNFPALSCPIFPHMCHAHIPTKGAAIMLQDPPGNTLELHLHACGVSATEAPNAGKLEAPSAEPPALNEPEFEIVDGCPQALRLLRSIREEGHTKEPMLHVGRLAADRPLPKQNPPQHNRPAAANTMTASSAGAGGRRKGAAAMTTTKDA